MLEIPLQKGAGTPLYRQIADHLKTMIDRGALTGGYRLPGTRELAQALSVSRTTTSEAYALLAAQGYIVEKGRSGSFVAIRPPRTPCGPDGGGDHHLDLASERPSPGMLPRKVVTGLLRSLESLKEGEFFAPSPLEGHEGLREALIHHGVLRGIPVQGDHLVVTGGGIEGLSTALAALRALGTTKLWVEELTFPDIIPMAQAEGLNVASLPLGEEALVDCARSIGPGEALYLIPSFHNPTGRTLTFQARQELLRLGERQSFWIIEDDTYGEFRYGSASVPALKSLDGAERVLYIGSFSQLLFPGLRIGYGLLPPSMKDPFLAVRGRRFGPLSTLTQKAALAFIVRGGLDEGLRRLRSLLKGRMDRLASALARAFPQFSVVPPQGGIYLWLDTMPRDGEALASAARTAGVALAEGRLFAWPPRPVAGLRFSVSRLDGMALMAAVRHLKEVW